MDFLTFKAAFEAAFPEPTLEGQVARFDAAFKATGGDVHSAMAAVNEVLAEPVSFEELMDRFRRAA